MKYINLNKILVIILSLHLFSCAPIIENRGYVFDEKVIAKVEIGKTNATNRSKALKTKTRSYYLCKYSYYFPIFSTKRKNVFLLLFSIAHLLCSSSDHELRPRPYGALSIIL